MEKKGESVKIVFLSYYLGKVNRGVETYVAELSKRLIKRGHEVEVFQGENSTNIKCFTQRVLSKLDKDTDIIVATNGGWQSILCKIWCLKHGKKLVIPGQSGPGFDDRLNLWTFPNAFVGLTEHQRNWSKSVNPFVRTVKIPNGVDLNIFKPVGKPLKISLPEPIILCVSALVPVKRLDLAIKAVAKTQGSLLLVGKGESEQELKDLGEKYLPGRFQILSFAHSQMPQVYKSADLFTYPTSPWESFGIAMLEVMATGVAVVATDDPIRREIVGEAGLFVDPNNTKEYANTLKKALSIEWGSKPREQAEKFSWEEIAKQYDKLFKELL